MTLTLAATQLVAGQASAPGVVNYAISLDDIGTADAFQLVQGTLTASAASLYAPAASHSAIVKGVQLKNTSASGVTVTMFLNGTASGNQAFQMVIPANGSATYDGRWTVYDSSGFAQTAGATGPTGARGATYRGVYSGATAYVPDDIVTDSGSSWINLSASTGVAPPTLPTTSNAKWSLVAAKGDQGIQGPAGPAGVVTTVVAGAGLTGGGSAASVTVDVVANADGSIVVNADDIQVGNITEKVQDVVGALVVDSTLLDATYNDPGNTFTLDLLPQAQGILLGRTLTGGTGIPVPLTGAQIAVILGLALDPVRDYGAKFDHRVVFDGATTGGTNQISSATAAFTVADVGKRIVLVGAGASGAAYAGTITAQAGTSCTVTPNTSVTVSAKGLQVHTDDLAAWNQLVSDVNGYTSPGARVIMPRFGTNRSGISAQINTITKQLSMDGIGTSYNHDTGDYTKGEGSVIAYAGTSPSTNGTFGAVLTFAPSSGATAQAMIGPFLKNFSVDCRNGDQNNALIGIDLRSCHGFFLDGIFVMDPLAVGMIQGVIQPGTAGALGEDKGCDRGWVTNYHCRCLENSFFSVGGVAAAATLTPTTTTSAITLTTSGQSLVLGAANGLPAAGYVWVMTTSGYPVLVNYTGGGGTTTLTGCTVSLADSINAPTTMSGCNVVCAVPNNAAIAILDGDLTANTNLCVFEMWQCSIGTNWGPAGVEYRNCDTIDSRQVVINGGSPTSLGAINRVTRPGIRFNGSNTNVALPARNNTMRGGDAGAGGVSSMGLLGSGAKMAFPTGPNYWDLYQLGNGAPTPVVEQFASFDWTPNGGLRDGAAGPVLVADQAVPAATLTQINGSQIVIPPQGLQPGTKIRWTLDISKSAAGVAARSWFIRVGANGTTADAIVATFTQPVPTAAIDQGKMVIEWTIQSGTPPGSAVVSRASCLLIRQLNTAAGLIATVTTPQNYLQVSGTAFDARTSGLLYAALSLTTGAAEVITVSQCSAEILKPANP